MGSEVWGHIGQSAGTELDPNNEAARLERQRSEELKKHLEGVN
jgi:hypothetical protein